MNHITISKSKMLAFCLALAMALTVGVLTAQAASSTSDVSLTFENAFSDIQGTPVYQDACTKTCHANIAKTKNYDGGIVFTHAYHQLIDCASCHPKFPHRTDAKIERPNMKTCFNCHGLDHGPMGLLATGQCDKCHLEPRTKNTMPSFHTETPNWVGAGHVDRGTKETNTTCMMCHTQESCDDCHSYQYVHWKAETYAYDAENGCQACHASTGLSKASSSGRSSFTVSGIGDSVHQDITCVQCHVDYNYAGGQEGFTNSWNVNVGNACADCHEKQEDKRLSKPVAEYKESIHAEEIAKSNLGSATCGSCHGGHFIYTLTTPTGQARMQASSYRTCARCKQHGEDYTTYNDYYHGKAYKAGAPDAPACWECHGSHKLWGSKDKRSDLYEKNIGKTCGQDGCHPGQQDEFGLDAGELIHSKTATVEANPVVKFINGILNKEDTK